MKHTPGPWEVTHRVGGPTNVPVIRANDRLIATIRMDGASRSQIESDAALIAAAPELLDALINLVNIVNELDFQGFDTKGESPEDWTRQANAAITKAKAEQS